MPTILTPNSREARERIKFEQHTFSDVRAIDDQGNSIPPGNPYTFRPYPTMLYKARVEQGVIKCLEPPPDALMFEKPDAFQRALDLWDRTQRQSTRQVMSEAEHREAERAGWKSSPELAIAHQQGLEDDMARAAAEANFAVHRMSEKARAEYAAKDAASGEFVTDVTSADVKRGPGRPRKD